MIRTGVALAVLAVAMAGAAEAQVACESLKGFSAPDVRVTAAAPATTPVPLCKLDGVIGKEINFSIWLPDNWNGKFVMGGQGGFAGRVDNQAIGMNALQQGYATAGTDTGHVAKDGTTDGSWAMGDLERIVNFAHAAVHRVTVTSKAVVQSRYGRAPERSYFAGCSNGGREALMAAQRCVHGVVMLAALGMETDPHRHIFAVGRMLPAYFFTVHDHTAALEQDGKFAFQADAGGAHDAELEYTGELEAVIRVVRLDFHGPIIGALAAKPKGATP